jgi:hypothetical protein
MILMAYEINEFYSMTDNTHGSERFTSLPLANASVTSLLDRILTLFLSRLGQLLGF